MKSSKRAPVPPKPALAPKRNPKQLTAAQNKAIVDAYLAGQRIVNIAENIGVTAWTINHRLNVAGVMRRSLSMSDAEIDRAISLRAAGLSSKKIGAKLGYAPNTITKKLRERGAW